LNYAKRGLATFIVAIFAAMLLGAATPTPDPYAVSPDCAQLWANVSKDACSPALGRWLPDFDDPNATKSPDRTRLEDAFVDPTVRGMWFAGGPSDGTFFTYGVAGPPKGHVVYDRRHGIAFFHVGCCAWGRAVLAFAPSPPKRVVDRDLSHVHTKAGIWLGQSPSEVMRIFGHSTLRGLPGRSGLGALAYTTLDPKIPKNESPCNGGRRTPQWTTFLFHDQRLVYIEIREGC
jgi:hypothetical protein